MYAARYEWDKVSVLAKDHEDEVYGWLIPTKFYLCREGPFSSLPFEHHTKKAVFILCL